MKNLILNSDISKLKEIGVNNIIENCAFIGNDIIVGNNCTIRNSIIKNGVTITDSYIECAQIGKNTSIGPYSRIRPYTFIGDNCKIGNFVEIKNSTLKNNVKVSHLSYVGDSVIGDDCNIGCGVVFANYNGKNKSKIIVGKNCFLGSNCNLVAPLKIEDDSYICAGTTLTESTGKGDFVIGRVKAIKKEKYSFYLKHKV